MSDPATSPVLSALMASLDTAPAARAFSTQKLDVEPGSVSLLAHVAERDGRWWAWFSLRLGGTEEPVEDLWHLVDHVRTGSFHAYGPSVAFIHDPAVFDARSRELLGFLEGLQRRQAGAEGFFEGLGQAAGTPVESGVREAALTVDDLVELLDIHGEFDEPLLLTVDGEERATRVLREDPALTVTVTERADGSLALALDAPAPIVRSDERLYLWRGGRFYKCSHDFAAVGDLLQGFMQADALVVGACDRSLFCRTVLPLMEEHLTVGLPPELLAEYLAGQRDTGAGLDDLVESFKRASSAPCPEPAGLCATLRPYQEEGLRWMNLLCDMGLGGVLADEMGLGKTVQVIALILARQQDAAGSGPCVVVCPSSLVYNWASELERFAPRLCVETLTGASDARRRKMDGHAQVLVCSYDIARIDCGALAALRPYLLVLDEAQYIKTPGAKTTQAIKRIPAEHAFALTGTPVENRPAELWSIFDFVMPGYLGSFRQFRARFGLDILAGSEEAADELHTLVAPFLLRRKKADVARHLPEKLESTVVTPLTAEERAVYEEHAERLRAALQGGVAGEPLGERGAEVLGELTRLREACCWPGLVDDGFTGPSSKADVILELVQNGQAAGERALVFSQFTGFLDLLGRRLDEAGVPYYRLDGSTSKRQRADLVERFNGGDVPVFLISLKAGGTGLTLTGASMVIHADPWWNLAEEEQATDRAHRIGQTQTVKVYKVIAQDTVEERIVELQRKKARFAGELVDQGGADLAGMSPQDLLALLEEGR
ncbi:SNF2-related protein [Olsenella sp. YH-ols2217]|uniref:SNF2-related protein n=1 Tax=Kribbibacterium absianum TaxID=3044210 RepID=A0ABT6ZLV4_9ACTN|nr:MULTISPECIES: DEAD/DEAH box helicase [unclassified Olsenella]MDJ1122027.1 SNF2-related protein [Olsenella sp. YH-ols2216]MDJ1130035.1 SNF2-related protein [Olsenella sp. YH-ols2217]